jgi:leader peptidase (prepilin peptidase)/N-methyltransferase
MFTILTYFLFTIFGLVIGSFLSALTYRIPNGISILKGRSFCPKCKSKISWYDNIPVFSFYFLGGKCRSCKAPISLRYPLIEFFTLLVFLFITIFFSSCANTLTGSAICQWRSLLGFWALPYLLIITSGLLAVFIIDLEKQIIPDSLVFSLFALTALLLILINPEFTYVNILASFGSATFLLMINLFTKGKGMGLGDVKLALLGGIVLGWPGTITWLLTSFVTGAVVGLILILFKKAEFGKHIPFGPFLVFSFFVSLVLGNYFFQAFIR